MSTLFEPLALGDFRLSHRIVMSPVASLENHVEDGAVSDAMVEYYRARATEGGLIVTEASPVSNEGAQTELYPGIHSSEQSNRWRDATGAIHAKGGIVVCQLWHPGWPTQTRPIDPSKGRATAAKDRWPPEVNSEPSSSRSARLNVAAIEDVMESFRRAAEFASDAGFDGVEVHSGHGGLIEQVLAVPEAHTENEYAGGVANRALFLHDVISVVASVWGHERVGVRVTPFNLVYGVRLSDSPELISEIFGKMNKLEVAYTEVVLPSDQGKPLPSIDTFTAITPIFRRFRPEGLIYSGGLTLESANRLLNGGAADAVGFGRAFAEHPDLVAKLSSGRPL